MSPLRLRLMREVICHSPSPPARFATQPPAAALATQTTEEWWPALLGDFPLAASKTKTSGEPVLVTTANRGVFFGYVDDRRTAPTTLKLTRARCCVRWANTKGFIGLAESGPNDDCRIGPAADAIELFNITSIADVSPKAVEAWERAPWRR